MLVRDLIALLSREHPDSPVTVEGLCPHGDFLAEADLYIDRDEGPTPEIDEVNISWVAEPEVERQFAARSEVTSESRSRHLP